MAGWIIPSKKIKKAREPRKVLKPCWVVLPPVRTRSGRYGWSFETKGEAHAWVKKYVGAKYRKDFEIVGVIPSAIN